MAYAGDLRPTEAWELLKAEPAAQLVDVRTRPEWTFVGIPDLDSIGKKPVLLAWQDYPAMQINPTFAESSAAWSRRRRRPAVHLPIGRALARGRRGDGSRGLSSLLQRCGGVRGTGRC
jgi:rhodanese-related sulfurtransferase